MSCETNGTIDVLLSLTQAGFVIHNPCFHFGLCTLNCVHCVVNIFHPLGFLIFCLFALNFLQPCESQTSLTQQTSAQHLQTALLINFCLTEKIVDFLQTCMWQLIFSTCSQAFCTKFLLCLLSVKTTRLLRGTFLCCMKHSFSWVSLSRFIIRGKFMQYFHGFHETAAKVRN